MLGALALLVALAIPPQPSDEIWADAAAGIDDAALAALATDLWEETLRGDPVWAGRLGDDRYLGQLPDLSPEALQQRRRRLVELDQRAATLPESELSAGDRITLQLARRILGNELLLHDAQLELWLVSPRRGPHVSLFSLALDQPTDTPARREALLERWERMGPYVDTATTNLERGLRRGLVANQGSVETAVAQLDRLLDQDLAEWTLAAPPLPDDLDAETAAAFLEAVRATLRDGLRPALERHRDLLRHRVLPRARSDEAPGLTTLPAGDRLYARLIEVHTALPLTARELHEFGLEEVARIRAEMAALGRQVFDLEELTAVQEKLRNDPELHFTTREEVQQKAETSLARAREAMGDWFGILPRAPCEVVRIPATEEQETTIAYYRGPAADGSLPGRYFVNTWAPETRPRYEAEVLAFHEAIPGHHLQIAIAQELEAVPVFRRHLGNTAFVEGWALYTERLCDEMELYTSDLDRLGMLSFDAWRACRLVVDTGLHAYGWSRQRAIDYMTENTLLAPNNIENEVDRYITSPGQALAYKTGQREILRLRAEAEQQLGDAFDIKGFHDRVLSEGGVTLDILRANVGAWIAAQTSDTSRNPEKTKG